MSINLTKDTIDLSKTYRTRDGSPVTLLHRAPFDWPSDCYPWRGLIDGNPATWTDNGHSWEQIGTPPNSDDLIEVLEPREWRAVVIKGSGNLAHYEEGDEHLERFEVIRVREILDQPTP